MRGDKTENMACLFPLFHNARPTTRGLQDEDAFDFEKSVDPARGDQQSRLRSPLSYRRFRELQDLIHGLGKEYSKNIHQGENHKQTYAY